MNLPPFPSLPSSPQERLRLLAYGEICARMERERCAKIAETPFSGEQDDITMEAKDRIAAAIRNETTAEVPATRV